LVVLVTELLLLVVLLERADLYLVALCYVLRQLLIQEGDAAKCKRHSERGFSVGSKIKYNRIMGASAYFLYQRWFGI
jgi:hypothetical protein